jgi:flotillin
METIILSILIIGFVSIVSVAAAVFAFKNLLYISGPNEVLVFSGVGDGTKGYRFVKGGRGWRVPLIERVDRMDLSNMIIDVVVQNAYSDGGIPLTVQGVANVKVASHEPALSNAVERLLGKSREEIVRIAKEVLEGTLRGVLSRLTPEMVNEDKISFAEKLLDEAERDLARLGLELDTMKIQNVHDERGYLDSIGRRQSAEVVKKARIAEAEARSKALQRDAEYRTRARFKEIESQAEIAKAKAERRIGEARSRGVALIAEAEGQVLAEVARSEAALLAEEARVERVRLQLEADVLQPAQAEMAAGIAAAQGRSANILEQGRATARVLDEMVTVWKAAGENARDIFLMQKFQAVLGALVDTIGTVRVDRVTMLPGRGGGDDTALKAARLVEELKGAVGIDLPKLLQDATRRDGPSKG